MNNHRGLTVLELIASITIALLILTSSFSVTSSFLSRIKISNAVSSITSFLSEARYLALSEERKVRLKITGNKIYLQIMTGHKWKILKHGKIKGEIDIVANASPVFSPQGTASPMCSIKISNKMYRFIITLSFAGRIKIKKIES